MHLASTTCILSSENLNALDNGPVHQKVNFGPCCRHYSSGESSGSKSNGEDLVPVVQLPSQTHSRSNIAASFSG